MTEPVTIGNLVKYVVGSGDKVINLVIPMASGWTSFHDQSTDTDYQVPVGRKLIILQVDNQHNFQPKQHSSSDINGGTYLGMWNGDSSTGNSHNTHAIVNAGNFVNAYTNNYYFNIVGLETDV